MVDIYNSRRTNHFKCKYWKRNTVHYQDNEELIYRINPEGIFYARIISSKSDSDQDVANVFKVGYEELTLETSDNVNIEHEDIVLFDNALWFVERANSDKKQKNAQYMRNTSKKTTMLIRRGKQ